MTLGETRQIVYAVLAEHERCEVKKILLHRCLVDREFRWAMAKYGETIFVELVEFARATVH